MARAEARKRSQIARPRRRGRRENPLVSFTPADAEFLRRYRSVLSVRAKAKGESVEGRKGKAKLFGIGERARATLSGAPTEVYRGLDGKWRKAGGRSLTGKTYVARHELLNLEVAMRRFPKGLSERAQRDITGRIGARKKREWWNIVDDTAATKFALTPEEVEEREERGEDVSSSAGFAATYAPPQTCPADCAMRGGKPGEEGCDDPDSRLCYAGEHNALQQWKALHKGYTGLPWRSFLRKLRGTPSKIVRVNIAGDLPADMSDPSRRHLDAKRVFDLALAASRHGRNAFTYTHYDPTYRDNAAIIRKAIRAGLQINLSADNLRDADRKAAMGFDVAVVLPRISYDEKDPKTGLLTGRKLLVAQGHGLSTPEGRKIFFCPSITTTTGKKEAKARVKRLAKRLGRPPNLAERVAVYTTGARAGSARAIGKTCATCTPSGPECGKVRRNRIIGFLAHGSAGGAKNLDPARAAELFLAPKLTPVARAEIELAIRKAQEVRAKEGAKKLGAGARGLVLTNPRRGRRRSA